MGSTIKLYAKDTTNQSYDLKSKTPKNSLSSGTVDYLIITNDAFESFLEPLAEWKTQKGLVTKIKTINEIHLQYPGRSTPKKIKDCIIDFYNNKNTQWVLLAGDDIHVPSQYAYCPEDFPWDGDFVSCDTYYTDLDNNWDLNGDDLWGTNLDEFDYEAEVYVGRLTANNEIEMQNLVQQILNYEKNPPIGSWMSHALFAGSILQFDQDWNNDSIVDYGECDGNRFHNFLKNLLPDNWTSIFLAQTQGIKGSDNHSDLQLDYNNLRNAINEGSSIGSIFAHGAPQVMAIDKWTIDYDGDMLFDYTADPFYGDGDSIDTAKQSSLIDTSYAMLEPVDNKLGLFYLGSCSTGTFDDPNDCLAEYFLKNAAIGVIAGSNVVWGEDQWYERDHGGWFIEGLGFRFWEQLFQYNQPGKALALAKADYAIDRNNTSEIVGFPAWDDNMLKKWEDKALKQYNLLGDPEVPIWFSIPKQLNLSVIQPSNNNGNTITLMVTAEGEAVQGATITYTTNNDLLWKGTTLGNGTIDVPQSIIDLKGTVLTVSKIGYLPYQESILQGGLEAVPGYDISITFSICVSFIIIYIIYFTRFKRLKNET
ncbi:MAG: C25 family cysteine peptidase [Candidatus Hodarchaeota archaeon]